MGKKDKSKNKGKKSNLPNNDKKNQQVNVKTVSRYNWKEFLSKPINQLLFKFAFFLVLFYILWATPFFQSYIVESIAQAYAFAAGVVLNLFGYGVTISGDTVISDQFSISIKNGCDGIEGLAIFLCAIIIYPATISQKIKGTVIGVLFLVFLNLIRIISLYMFGIHFPSIFDIMHESVWQVVFIILTLLALFNWIAWTKNVATTLK